MINNFKQESDSNVQKRIQRTKNLIKNMKREYAQGQIAVVGHSTYFYNWVKRKMKNCEHTWLSPQLDGVLYENKVQEEQKQQAPVQRPATTTERTEKL